MSTIRERHQMAREAGERIAQQAIVEHNVTNNAADIRASMRFISDYIRTETDGMPGMHSARLAAFHYLQATLLAAILEY